MLALPVALETSASQFIVLVALDLLGLAWLWAAAGKARDIPGFTRAAGELLPPSLRRAVPLGARTLPAVEAALGLLLLLGRLVVPALAASCALLAFFTVVLVRARARGIETACACFGSRARAPVDGWTVLRTALLLGVAVLGLATTSAGGIASLEVDAGARMLAAALAAVLLAATAVTAAAAQLLTTVERRIRPEGRGVVT